MTPTSVYFAHEILDRVSEIIAEGATLVVTDGSPEATTLLIAPLAPTVTIDPWDTTRLIVRPLVAWPATTSNDQPGFSLQDCRLRGIPSTGTVTDSHYLTTNLFDELIRVRPADDKELTVIGLWEDFLNSLSDDERGYIETHQDL